MRRRLSTLFCRYEPRLLSRSTTILKPSTRMCCSIVWRTFEAAIGFSASRFVGRFRVGGVSARTGAILIGDRNCDGERGQWGARAFCPLPSACCRRLWFQDWQGFLDLMVAKVVRQECRTLRAECPRFPYTMP